MISIASNVNIVVARSKTKNAFNDLFDSVGDVCLFDVDRSYKVIITGLVFKLDLLIMRLLISNEPSL